MRDAVNMWVSDDRGQVGLPRFAVEASMPDWDHHDLQVNVGFPDGRVYRLREAYPSLPAVGPDGLAATFGAGPLVFHLAEPFGTWTAEFRGTAIETSTEALSTGPTRASSPAEGRQDPGDTTSPPTTTGRPNART
jgi:hypothetical protein